MAETRSSRMALLALGCLLSLSACADAFTGSSAPVAAGFTGDTRLAPEGTAIVWEGIATGGRSELPACAPFAFDVTVHKDPLSLPAPVEGRAYTLAGTGGLRQQVDGFTTTWWVEGYQNVDRFMQIESRMQRPVIFRARPHSVWRGVEGEDGRIVLIESGSPCGRELVLTRR
jgi:hypothetical protein